MRIIFVSACFAAATSAVGITQDMAAPVPAMPVIYAESEAQPAQKGGAKKGAKTGPQTTPTTPVKDVKTTAPNAVIQNPATGVVTTPAAPAVSTNGAVVLTPEEAPLFATLNKYADERNKKLALESQKDLDGPWDADDTASLANDVTALIGNVVDITSASLDIKGTNDDKKKAYMALTKTGTSMINDLVQKLIVYKTNGGMKGYFRAQVDPVVLAQADSEASYEMRAAAELQSLGLL